MTDLRDAVRSLRATPAFTLVALGVLALGIGATTAIFSVVDAVVLRSLPFDQPDSIVALGERSTPGKGFKGAAAKLPPAPGIVANDTLVLSRVQPQNYLDWVSQQPAFERFPRLPTPNSRYARRTASRKKSSRSGSRRVSSMFCA